MFDIILTYIIAYFIGRFLYDKAKSINDSIWDKDE